MWVHDPTGTLLIIGVWLACAIGGGMLSAFVDGERQPVRNTLGLLALGYPIAITQSLRGWIPILLVVAGVVVALPIFRWYQRPPVIRGRPPTTPPRREDP
jgi:hypothetical protein